MAGDLRRLRGDRDKKAFLTVSFMPAWTGYSSWLQNYIKSTSKLHHFYITFTSLIHHFYIIPSAHTSLSSSVPFVHHPLPERADSGFSGCAGNASRPRNKLRPRSPFSDGKNAGNRTYPGWMVWISALCTCAHTHACRKNRACAFLAGFRVVCCLFYRFPVRNALRASAAVHATDVMVNQASLLWDFAVFLEHLCILYTSFVWPSFLPKSFGNQIIVRCQIRILQIFYILDMYVCLEEGSLLVAVCW